MEDLKNISKDKFEFVQIDEKIFDKKFETKAVGYFGDALRRFSRNKSSVMGFIILVLIILLAIIGPSLVRQNGDNGSLRFKELPPKVPGLASIGIFDGTKEYFRVPVSAIKDLVEADPADPSYANYFFNDFITKMSDPYTVTMNNSPITVVDLTYDMYESALAPYVKMLVSQEEYDKLEEKGAIIGDPLKVYDDFPGFEQYDIYVDPLREYGFEKVSQFYFLFGSDSLGRDLWSRVWQGTRVSLLIGLFVAIVTVTMGILYGSISGYYGGTTDLVMQRIAEILGGIPWIVIMTLVVLYLGSTLFTIALALVLTSWIGTANMVRSQFYRYKGREYVLASRTLGAKDRRLIFKHILPNALGPIVTASVLIVPSAIFTEATISYLGLGISDGISIGLLLSTGQSIGIVHYPHLTMYPALVISLLMISFNLFGNGLRDALNPSLRGVE